MDQRLSEPDGRQPVLALVSDLLFASKISSAAQRVGGTAKIIRKPSALGEQPGLRLLVDLTLPDALDAAVKWRSATGGQVIGFINHTDTATIHSAQAAGLDRVLTRGQFVQMLGEMVS